MSSDSSNRSVLALRVPQWLNEWDDLVFDRSIHQARPPGHFYLFSLPAPFLRSLAGIYPRSTEGGVARRNDFGIQRKHDPIRSQEIERYVHGGYPWSSLSATRRKDPANDKLKKPGWLPTALVVNILVPGDKRNGMTISDDDIIAINDIDQVSATLSIPMAARQAVDQVPPIEVIDGQHRLFAFDESDSDLSNFHLPVVAFQGLDISWQAYLFWTVNIKPKKINPSLAFDLYPLLREEEWLESGETVQVYKESRAQELTEILWSTPGNPWFRRINMLGGTRKDFGPVTQAAFINSLTSSLVKSWRSTRLPGGIFGGMIGTDAGLSWSRLQQSAFLFTSWAILYDRINNQQSSWTEDLRSANGADESDTSSLDPAFVGTHSLLATDQGIRGFQFILNDFCYLNSAELDLHKWKDTFDFEDVTPEAVRTVAETLHVEPAYEFLQALCEGLASFDWRTSSAPDLNEGDRLFKAALRGSGGYQELRRRLVQHLTSNSNNSTIVATAKRLAGVLAS